METTVVSVVVPTLDRPALLAEALASVRRLEGASLSLEILVADNGNSEATAKVISEFGAERIAVARRGASAARNEGMKRATGEFIAFLDDDDVWLPGHLRDHIELMRGDPTIGAVLGQVRNASPDLQDVSDPWPSEIGPPQRVFRQLLGCYPQIGATVIRASELARVGYFDETLPSDEDWDWHLRLALACRVAFVPTPCVLFRQRPLSGGDLEWQRMRFSRIVLWMNVKRSPKRFSVIAHAMAALRRSRGGYAYYFACEAGWAYARRSRSGARLNIGRAIVASPPHAIAALFQHTGMRNALAAFLPARKAKGVH